jgi:Family of unknown function (DUF6130)
VAREARPIRRRVPRVVRKASTSYDADIAELKRRRAAARWPDKILHSSKKDNAMTLIKTLAAVAAGTMLATSAFAQSAREIRGASPYVAIENEPAPKLIVDPPLPEGLAIGVYWAQYRVENLRIVPVFGAGALQVSPRIGHLHVIVDDLPWWWADASDNNTVDIAGLPPGEHKVKIALVDANHNVIPGQEVTHTFTVPASAKLTHDHHGN